MTYDFWQDFETPKEREQRLAKQQQRVSPRVNLDPNYFYLTPTYKPVADVTATDAKGNTIAVDEFVPNQFSTDTQDERLIAKGEEFLNHEQYGIAAAWLAEQRVATELAGGEFDKQGIWRESRYDDGTIVPAVRTMLVHQMYYSGGSPHDVDLLIDNPRYGNVIVDEKFSWYVPPQWLGGDVKLVRPKWKTPCYTWDKGFVIDDEGDLPLEFFLSVYNSNPLTFLFKTSPSLNYTVVVGMNKFVNFFPDDAAGRPCRKYKTDEPVLVWQLATTLTHRDTQKKTYLNIDEFKMTVATAMTDERYGDAMNELTKKSSYLTRELLTYVVAEVDPLNKYEFLESLSLQATSKKKDKQLVNHTAIREMFGLN